MQLAGHMAISEAPEPTDVTWINMYTTRTGQVRRPCLAPASPRIPRHLNPLTRTPLQLYRRIFVEMMVRVWPPGSRPSAPRALTSRHLYRVGQVRVCYGLTGPTWVTRIRSSHPAPSFSTCAAPSPSPRPLSLCLSLSLSPPPRPLPLPALSPRPLSLSRSPPSLPLPRLRCCS